jgi:tRNA(Ile)-lysidine synthase
LPGTGIGVRLVSAFIEKVEELIKKENLIDPGMKVVVGVSGGADSVALLSVLRELAPSYSMELHVAHLNHLLRDEAGDDAAFVQRLARSLGVPSIMLALSDDGYQV